MQLRRSNQREEFLDDVFTIFIEGGVGAVAIFIERPRYDDEIGRYDPVLIRYDDEDDGVIHRVTLETIARGFSLSRQGPVDFLSETSRRRFQKAYREYDAGEVDAHDASDLVEIGLFGEVRY